MHARKHLVRVHPVRWRVRDIEGTRRQACAHTSAAWTFLVVRTRCLYGRVPLQVADWHKWAVLRLQAHDPYNHLCSTSFAQPPGSALIDPLLDFTQTHRCAWSSVCTCRRGVSSPLRTRCGWLAWLFMASSLAALRPLLRCVSSVLLARIHQLRVVAVGGCPGNTTSYGEPDMAAMVQNWTAYKRDAYGVPTMVGEFGLPDPTTAWASDSIGANIVNGLLAPVFSGGAGTAMTWWWCVLGCAAVQPARRRPPPGLARVRRSTPCRLAVCLRACATACGRRDNYVAPHDLYHLWTGPGALAHALTTLSPACLSWTPTAPVPAAQWGCGSTSQLWALTCTAPAGGAGNATQALWLRNANYTWSHMNASGDAAPPVVGPCGVPLLGLAAPTAEVLFSGAWLTK
jgi:hypothetical protein